MSKTIILDRAYPFNIIYPIGVKESVTITYLDETTLTDTYQIAIAEQDGTIFELINETDPQFTKVDNKLIWDVNYEYGDINIQTYNYELRNLTQDYRDLEGTFKVTKTLKNG